MHQTAPAPAPTVRRKRKSRRKRYIWMGIGGLILLLILSSIIRGKREQPIPVTTEKASRRTIVQTVSATGKVQWRALQEAELARSDAAAG